MRRETDFAWTAARASRNSLRWLLLVAAAVAVVMYLRLGEIRDPVVAMTPPPAVELPTRKPPLAPTPLERVHILNADANGEPADSVSRPDREATTYHDLRRQLLTRN
jgi:hypothetical protein